MCRCRLKFVYIIFIDMDMSYTTKKTQIIKLWFDLCVFFFAWSFLSLHGLETCLIGKQLY